MQKLSESQKWLFRICLGGILLVSIKRIFMDFDIDCEYAVAMSYRMAQGDCMISQMWEPHQTSAFLNALFIRLYLLLTGTTTGIVLYLNTVAMLVKAGIAVIFYRTLHRYCDLNLLLIICTFFMFVNAKGYPILDFSNMMVYFSVLLCCALFTYLQGQKEGKTGAGFLLTAALCFCMEILSYPSVVILFPFLIGLLIRYSKTKWRDILIFLVFCAAFGICYLFFLVSQAGGWEPFLLCGKEILTGDQAHQIREKFLLVREYLGDILRISILMTAILALAIVICGICAAFGVIKKETWKKQCIRTSFYLWYALYLANTLIGSNSINLSVKNKYLYLAIYFPILLLAFWLRRYCSSEEKMMYEIGMSASVWSSIAVLILTNLTFLTAMAYLILAVMVSMLPLGKYLINSRQIVSAERSGKPGQSALARGGTSRCYSMILIFLSLVFFRNIFLLENFGIIFGSNQVSLFNIRNIVRSGPAVGIISDYMGPHIADCNRREWGKNIHEGDSVLLVRDGWISAIGYLYGDTKIAVDSTISTPTYSEKLLRYWELNPEKEPNVVIVDCWFGELSVPEDEWIMQWIRENDMVYTDGTYIRFYRKR